MSSMNALSPAHHINYVLFSSLSGSDADSVLSRFNMGRKATHGTF